MGMIISGLRALRDGHRGGFGYKVAFARLEKRKVASRWGWKGPGNSVWQGFLEMFKKTNALTLHDVPESKLDVTGNKPLAAGEIELPKKLITNEGIS